MERQLTLKLKVADVLATWPQVIPVFLRHRMACVGCAIAPFETLENAARFYSLEPHQFLIELNQVIQPTIMEAQEKK